MDPMTKLEGVPTRDQAIAGMAHFAGTGPFGKTCGDCKFRGLYRESAKVTWNEREQNFVHKTYRTTQCQMFKKLCGEYGTPVKKEYDACKYFEAKKSQ